MSEFEKQIKNKEYTWCGVPIDKEKTNAIAKQIWKTVLEWVYDYMKEQEPNALYFDYVLFDKIEKELESLKNE